MRIITKTLAYLFGILFATGSALHAGAERAPSCLAANVSVTQGESDAGMSKVELKFIVQNQAHTSCFLQGRPVVIPRGNKAQILRLAHPSPPGVLGPKTAPRITVKPGGTAEFSIYFGTSNPFSKGECPARTSELLIVFPREAGSKSVNVDLDVCTRLRVSPFVLGLTR